MKFNNVIFIIKQLIMSLLNKLTKNGSQLSGLDGETPNIPNFQQSTLHRDYSVNNDPNADAVRPRNGVLPQPSTMDPQQPPVKYLDNLPK
jgi:hypothetical protein